jgi:hypothetical protein
MEPCKSSGAGLCTSTGQNRTPAIELGHDAQVASPLRSENAEVIEGDNPGNPLRLSTRAGGSRPPPEPDLGIQDMTLAERCAAYLRQGPPSQMTDYVPGSMIEIIIAHGAKSLALPEELREIGTLALDDAFEVAGKSPDAAIRTYLEAGAGLVKEVLEARQ